VSPGSFIRPIGLAGLRSAAIRLVPAAVLASPRSPNRPQATRHRAEIPIAREAPPRPTLPRVPSLKAFGRRPRRLAARPRWAVVRNPEQEPPNALQKRLKELRLKGQTSSPDRDRLELRIRHATTRIHRETGDDRSCGAATRSGNGALLCSSSTRFGARSGCDGGFGARLRSGSGDSNRQEPARRRAGRFLRKH
jgi:hypothetical protein